MIEVDNKKQSWLLARFFYKNQIAFPLTKYLLLNKAPFTTLIFHGGEFYQWPLPQSERN